MKRSITFIILPTFPQTMGKMPEDFRESICRYAQTTIVDTDEKQIKKNFPKKRISVYLQKNQEITGF